MQLILSLVSLGLIVLVIMAVYEIVTSSKSTGHKALWALMVLFVPVFGLVLYALLGRPMPEADAPAETADATE